MFAVIDRKGKHPNRYRIPFLDKVFLSLTTSLEYILEESMEENRPIHRSREAETVSAVPALQSSTIASQDMSNHADSNDDIQFIDYALKNTQSHIRIQDSSLLALQHNAARKLRQVREIGHVDAS